MKGIRQLRAAVLAAALGACAPAPTVPEGPAVEVKPGGCERARDSDFAGVGEERLRGFLRWLAHTHGAPAGLDPRQVSLGIVRGSVKPGPMGVQAGEISCGNGGRGPFRVTLYRDALSGRPLATTYHTLAHEFHHVVQIRRENLPCDAGDGSRAAYEQEAEDVAHRFVPACR